MKPRWWVDKAKKESFSVEIAQGTKILGFKSKAKPGSNGAQYDFQLVLVKPIE